MIKIKKKIIVYSHLVTEVYSCNCFFDRVNSLIDTNLKITKTNEFIDILEEEFDVKKYLILFFGGKIVLICKILLNFILKTKKEDEKIHLTHCVTDFIESGEEIREICTVCFIKILVENKFLKTFITEKKVRDETYYIYL